MKKLCFLLIFPFFTQCSSTSTNSSSDAKSIPVLSSPARAQAWGAPELSKSASGYTTTYTNPSNSKEKLRIIGSSKMMPFLAYPPAIAGTNEQQVWNKTLVNGSTVKWYQSSAPSSQKAAMFRSLGLTLKDQSGGSGQYRIEVEGSKDQMRTWLTELRFGQ